MSRCWRPIRRLASVTVGALLISGCGGQPVKLPTTQRAPARPSDARAGRPGFVVAAPDGRRDTTSDAMAIEIARRTGFGLVAGGEAARDAGRDAYQRRVLDAAHGPLRFYAEIQGSPRGECAGPIEIGTVGIDVELAGRLRTLAELIRDAHLRANRNVQRLDVLVEPADRVSETASGSRRHDILRLPERGLHIELPRCTRGDWRDLYTAVLADFLLQATAVPVGR